MPELLFKGKEYVYNHHLTVPCRPLLPDAVKSVGPAALDGNLIIHGDNLHALKALLPRYAGQVDLVFIDPPYNTGNEGWCYSDSVRAPFIRQWLSGNPVGIEDTLRHAKWLAMMGPRLTLLRKLLSERGSLWMTLDDNEVRRARAIIARHALREGWDCAFADVPCALAAGRQPAALTQVVGRILRQPQAPKTRRGGTMGRRAGSATRCTRTSCLRRRRAMARRAWWSWKPQGLHLAASEDTQYKQRLLARLTQMHADAPSLVPAGELTRVSAAGAKRVCDLVIEPGWQGAMAERYFGATPTGHPH